jgi:hypothetical protein
LKLFVVDYCLDDEFASQLRNFVATESVGREDAYLYAAAQLVLDSRKAVREAIARDAGFVEPERNRHASGTVAQDTKVLND